MSWLTRWQALGLRRQLGLGMALVCALALSLAGAAMLLQLQRQHREALDETMLAVARLVADRSSATLAFRDARGAQENLAALSGLPDVAEACLLDVQQQVVASFVRHTDQTSACGAGAGAAGVPLEYRVEVRVGDDAVGQLWLRASADAVTQRLQPSLITLAQGLLLAMFAALLAAVPMRRWIAAPIERIRDVALAVEETEDMDRRAPDLGRHELGRLAQAFNRMLDTVQSQSARLSERERHARELFTSSHLAQLVLDLPSGQIIEANAAAALLLIERADAEALIGQQLSSFIVEQAELPRLDALQPHQPAAASLRAKRGDSIWDLDLHLLRVERDARSIVHASLEDVTQQLANRRALLQSKQELEQRVSERTRDLAETIAHLNQARDQLVEAEKQMALGRLVAGMAHEINTPVGNARLALSSLKEEARSLLPRLGQGLRRSELQLFLDHLIEASELADRNLTRVAELIGTFKQMAADEASSVPRRFLLDELIHGVLRLLSPQLKRGGHRVMLDIPPGIEMFSHAGPLDQVLMNLVQNALFHGLDGRAEGTVRISAQCLNEHSVRLCVDDDGAGIEEALLPRLFDPFFTTKMGRGGLGLGLSISRGLVQQVLGGQIQASNLAGGGARFELVLPLRAPNGTA